jgi:hypothetical protein
MTQGRPGTDPTAIVTSADVTALAVAMATSDCCSRWLLLLDSPAGEDWS